MRHSLVVLLLLALIVSSTAPPCRGADEKGDRYREEAKMMAHFAALITWPSDTFASTEDPFMVCVIEPNPFGNHLNLAFLGKDAGDRPIVVELRPQGADADGCQIAFVNEASKSDVAALVTQSGPRHVLTVTDEGNSFKQGFLVRFFKRKGDKLGFEINRNGAVRAGLKINDFLLTLSASMTKKGAQEQ